MENDTKYYLSASRAWNLLTNPKAFCKNYIFDEPPIVKQTWKVGNRVQDLIYCYLQNKPIEECKDLREHKRLADEGIYGVYGDLVPLFDDLVAIFPLIMSDKNKQNVLIEKEIFCHKRRLTGIPDIILPQSIIDIKTSTGDLSRWEKNNDLIRLGVQAFIYRSILQKDKPLPFLYLLIEAVYPFRIEIKTLGESWIEQCGELLDSIKVYYDKWIDVVGGMVATITNNKDWLRHPDNVKFKAEIYNALYDKKIIRLFSEVDIPQWEYVNFDEKKNLLTSLKHRI